MAMAVIYVNADKAIITIIFKTTDNLLKKIGEYRQR
jgi:hypothetical protein